MTSPRTWPALHVGWRSPLSEEERERLLVDVDDTAAIGLEDTDTGVSLYFQDTTDRDAASTVLAVTEWAARGTLEPRDVPDEGWAARSQADLPAVRVGRLTISPPWDANRARAEALTLPAGARPDVIEIEPSTGFGTGHHQSTRLCLRALQLLDVTGWQVLDVGTGSGVLAIAATRCGAAGAVGIDPDQDAIDSATDSVARNGATTVTLRTVGLDHPDLAPTDLVFGNLTGVLLRREAGHVQALIRPGGHAILSGFTEDDAQWVQDAFDQCDVEARLEEESWIALLLRRRAPAGHA